MNIRSLIPKWLICVLPAIVGAQMAKAQYVYKIKADTVRIYNTCDTAELVLQNRTQSVLGYLYNKGGGVTEFRTLGAVDSMYRRNDTLFYHTVDGKVIPVKIDLTAINDARYDLKSTNYITINAGDSANYGKLPIQKVVGIGAYNATDMPPLSRQAFQGVGNKTYYQGFAVSDGARGVNLMVNWDGELKGPNGAFLRTKDDTGPATWSNWRELVFKDYADTAYTGQQNLTSVLAKGDTANYNIVLGDNNSTNSYVLVNNRKVGTVGIRSSFGTASAGGNNGGAEMATTDGINATRMLIVTNTGGSPYYSKNGTTWDSLWHSGNDGAGSGLDADLLDGVNASGFISNQVTTPQNAGFWVNGFGVAATFNTGAATGTIQFSTNNGTYAANGSGHRWSIYHSTAEAAGNVGNDFNIGRYDNTGAFMSSTLTIQRSTGNIGIATQTPAQKLDVTGSIAASTSVITPTVTTQTISSGGGATSLSLQSGSTLTLNPGTSMVNVNGSVVATGYVTAGTALTVSSGSVQLPCQTVSASTGLAGVYTTFVNTSGITLTLLDAFTCKGRIYEIVNSSTGAITISSVLVFGAATTSIPAKTSWRIQSDGANWQLLSRSN